MAWLPHLNGQTVSIFAKKGPFIAILRLENDEVLALAHHETVFKAVDCADRLAERRLKNVALVLAIVGAEEHLTVIGANEDHTRLLRPVMAGEIGGNGAPLLQIVDLTVIRSENGVVLLLFSLLEVDESVAWAGDEHR